MEKIKLNTLRYRPRYHIAAKSGWINDPNGLVYFKGYYHVFFQHYPYGADWGPMHWGHVRSKDLIHWENLPIALTPQQEDGCFSGSALVYDGKLFLMYTAHHNLNADGSQSYQEQNLAYSEDGITFTKYVGNPVIKVPLNDNTENFRDPKLFVDGSCFYCAIGGQSLDKRGQVLLYQSHDLYHWKFTEILAQASSAKKAGYMWECPDYFEINGQKVLVISPQGIEPEGEFYHNLHENGYFIGKGEDGKLVYSRDRFQELDRGHDFYAAQTFLAPDGRRIMLAWMDMWEQEFPEKADGWAGMLTFPREVTLKDGRLIVKPVRELAYLRSAKLTSQTAKKAAYEFDNRCLELDVAAKNDLVLVIKYGDSTLKLSYENGVFELEKTGFEKRTITWNLKDIKLQVLCDQSSVEIFVEDGPVISERLYGQGKTSFDFSSSQEVKSDIFKLEL